MVRAKSLASFLLLALLVPAASSQQPASRDLNNLSLEQLMNVPFYTASKRSQKASETPASVTVVTAADIRAFGYRTLADILQGVPGFWINTDRAYSYVGVRGLARPGDYNGRILLLVNGHRMNEDIDDGALLGTEFPLDVDLIERVEIARGPSSSLYGTNAFFGVVNVITRKPPLAPSLEVSAEAATQFARKGRITMGTPQVLKGLLFSGTFYRADGNASLYYPEYDAPETNFGWANGMDGDRSANGFAMLQWKNFTLQGLLGSRRKVVPTGAYGMVFDDPRDDFTDDRGFVELAYHRDFASGMQINARGFYDLYRYAAKSPYDFGTIRAIGRVDFRTDWIGSEFTLSRPLGQHNILTAGTEFRYDLRQIMQASALAFPEQTIDSRHNSSVFAVYGQDELTLNSRLSLNFGLRLDQYSSFGLAASPRVAAIFHLNPNTTVKYIFGRAFRAPSVTEMYFADNFTSEINPSLQPETILSHNLALEHALKPGLTVSAEGFFNSMHNLIDTENDPATGLMRYVNAHAYNSKGLQFELLAQHRAWKAGVSYTLQKATDSETGQPLANAPLHLAKLNCRRRWGRPCWPPSRATSSRPRSPISEPGFPACSTSTLPFPPASPSGALIFPAASTTWPAARTTTRFPRTSGKCACRWMAASSASRSPALFLWTEDARTQLHPALECHA